MSETEFLKSQLEFYQRRLREQTMERNEKYIEHYGRRRLLHSSLEKAILLLKPAGFDVSEFEKLCEVERQTIREALSKAPRMGEIA